MHLPSPRDRPRKKPEGKYHHGELRRALVQAALGIIEREGTGAVSLSAAARRVGVSPQATYNHFRDKSALLAAVAHEALLALEQSMREARAAARSPGQRLEAVGVAYVAYAAARPAHFRLLSTPELAHKASHPELLAAYRAAFGVLLDAVRECQDAGIVRKGEPEELASAAWCTVHGAACLYIDGHIGTATTAADPEEFARRTVRALFKGLRAPRGESTRGAA